MIQLRNTSATEAFTINWSNATSTTLAAGGVGDVPEAVAEAEVDQKLAGLKYVEKVGGAGISDADLIIQYKATEGNDALVQLTPATVTKTVANSANAHTRDVIVEVVTSAGERISTFNDDITLTLSASSTGGDVAFDTANADLVIGNSAKVATLFLRKGYGKITVICSGLWADSDTNTVTTTEATFYGVTMTAKTSVETIAVA